MLTKEEIINKKQHGDLKIAGEMIGISQANAYAALNREGSKYHNEIKRILTKVIKMRSFIKNEAKKDIA